MTDASYSNDKCLHHLLEAQAARTPSSVAVRFGDREISYEKLFGDAQKLSNYLQSLGVRPASQASASTSAATSCEKYMQGLVGVMCERTPEMIVGVLAVLKAGGAYVPMEPTYPEDRLDYILSDTKARIILTQKKFVNRLANFGGQIICLDEPSAWENFPSTNLDQNPLATPDDIAYVMYTSGTTGRPKGVLVPHRGLVNLMEWIKKNVNSTYLKTTLFSTSVCFDSSIADLYSPLVCGGTLVLVKNILDLATPSENANSEPKFGVTFINCTPSGLAALLDVNCVPKSVRAIMLLGEYAHPELISKALNLQNVDLVLNTYGPTETTVYSTAVFHWKGKPICNTIGKPIDNTKIYVLADDHRTPLRIGEVGELCISGDAVAAGYLNRADLTSEKFLDDPFFPGQKMYCTGDLSSWQADGHLQYLGRRDHQIKLRGHRIELFEIEAVLAKCPTVQNNCVIVSGDQLIAYVTPASTPVDETLAFLRTKLPEYMVPSQIIPLTNFVTNTAGKIDRKALPTPTISSTTKPVPKWSPDEAIIAGLFSEVLDIPHSPALDDTFVKLGGTSLSAVRLSAKIRAKFLCNVPLALFFQELTVTKLANFVNGKTEKSDVWLKFAKENATHSPPSPALVYVHSAGGLAQSARWVAPFLDCPVFTFNHPHDREISSWKNLESMAEFYVKMLYEKFPEGPYMFAGHSFGALLAYEMARQIRRDGREVRFLGVVDEPAVSMPAIPNSLLYYFSEEHLLYYDAVTQGCAGVQERHRKLQDSQNDPNGWKLPGGIFLRDVVMLLKQQFKYWNVGEQKFLELLAEHYVSTIREHGGRVELGDPTFLVPLLRDIVHTIRLGEKYLQTLATGEYGKLDVPTFLFRAKDIPPKTGTIRDRLFYGPADYGWNKFLEKPIQVLDCEGDHITLQTAPNVQCLGEKMNQAISSSAQM